MSVTKVNYTYVMDNGSRVIEDVISNTYMLSDYELNKMELDMLAISEGKKEMSRRHGNDIMVNVVYMDRE